jgi:hypothetical protein
MARETGTRTERELAALFARLGASEPEAWARSQARDGVPQLERYLFLREAWRRVIKDGDASWVEAQMQTPLNEPGGAIGPALRRLLDAGADRDDLTTIVRVMQWRLLFDFCYLLSDPGLPEDEVRNVAWGLFQIDEQGRPGRSIDGLHESVLETDPEGREMRPK